MATQIDSIAIDGMKKADFEQLEEIFNHFERQGIYWGRKDYFNARQIRLSTWLRGINKTLEDKGTKIKCK